MLWIEFILELEKWQFTSDANSTYRGMWGKIPRQTHYNDAIEMCKYPRRRGCLKIVISLQVSTSQLLLPDELG